MLRAWLGVSAVIGLPGLLVAVILGFRLRQLASWAAIPVFSIATIFVWGEIAATLHVPFGVPAFLGLLAALVGVLALLRRRGPLSARPKAVERDQPGLVLAYVLLVGGIALGAITWARGLRGVPLIPPGGDATRHAFFVERIIQGQSIDPSRILTYDAGGSHRILHYYPLGLHATAALATRLSGADVGRVLVTLIVISDILLLPVGMFVLARMLAPGRALVAGFTALVVPMLMLYPYWPTWNGDLAQIAAMALVPVSIVLVRGALAGPPRVRLDRLSSKSLGAAALAIVCIAAVHTSEVPLVVFLALVLVAERAWRKGSPIPLRNAVVRFTVIALAAILLLGPTLIALARGISERTTDSIFVTQDPRRWESTLAALLQLHFGPGTVRQGFLALIALVGASLWLMWRRPAWVAGWVTVVLLTLFASSSPNPAARALTFPWYHLTDRLAPNVGFFVPFFAAVALGHTAVVLARAWRRPAATVLSTGAVVAVLALFVGVHAFNANSRFIHDSFDPKSTAFVNQAVVSKSSLDAFTWLRQHESAGDTVLVRPNTDGGLWMYAEDAVRPLVALTPLQPRTWVPQDLADRLYLVHHASLIGRDPRVDALVQRYHTRWIYLDKRFAISRNFLQPSDLNRVPGLRLAFHEGDTWIWRIG